MNAGTFGRGYRYRAPTPEETAALWAHYDRGDSVAAARDAVGVSHAIALRAKMAWDQRQLGVGMGQGGGASAVKVFTAEEIAQLERPDAPRPRCTEHRPFRSIAGGPWHCRSCSEIVPAPTCGHGTPIDETCEACRPAPAAPPPAVEVEDEVKLIEQAATLQMRPRRAKAATVVSVDEARPGGDFGARVTMRREPDGNLVVQAVEVLPPAPQQAKAKASQPRKARLSPDAARVADALAMEPRPVRALGLALVTDLPMPRVRAALAELERAGRAFTNRNDRWKATSTWPRRETR